MALLPKPFYQWGTYKGHSGIDFPKPSGTPIPASAPGRIAFSGWNGDRAGYTKSIQYDNGTYAMYSHLVNLNGLQLGERVDLGAYFAYVGDTGHSLGSHLHLETRAGTQEDVWKHFSKTEYVGQGSGSGGSEIGDNELDARQAQMLEQLWQQLLPGAAGVKTQGDVNKVFMETRDAALDGSAARSASAVWSTKVKRDGELIDAIQEVADTKTNTLRLLARPAAEAEFTDEQIQEIADAVSEQIAGFSLSPAQEARLVKLVNDDAAMRRTNWK